MEHLKSLPLYMADIIKRIDHTQSFHWGKQQELNRFLQVDQDEAMYRTFVMGASKGTFPLIWLVSGWESRPDDYDIWYNFDKVRLVFMQKTEKEWMNKERWETTFPTLTESVNCFLKHCERSGDHSITGKWKAREEENYAIRQKDAVLEHVDAIVLDFDLKVNKEYKC